MLSTTPWHPAPGTDRPVHRDDTRCPEGNTIALKHPRNTAPRTVISHLFPDLGGRSNAGVAERVAMSVTGHRCHIVSPTDLKAAPLKLAGTTTGTIG
jgi:hypothetical protein